MWKALLQLKNGKSPGSDGFPPDFYKMFWTRIKMHLLQSLNYGFNTGQQSVNQKRGILSLLPKPGKDHVELKKLEALDPITSRL